MVQAMINVDEKTNRILNIVKAKYGLNDKSQAIIVMAKEYEEFILEPSVRPSYLKKLEKTKKQKKIPFKSMAELRKVIENAQI